MNELQRLHAQIIVHLNKASDLQLEDIAAILGIETEADRQMRKDQADATAAYCAPPAWRADSVPEFRNDALVDVVYVGQDEETDDDRIRHDHAIATANYTWRG